MAFSATDAALEGFRIVRRNPGAVAAWAVLSLVFNFVMIGAMVTMVGPAFTEMAAMSRPGAAAADPAESMAMLGSMLGFYAIMIPLALLYTSVFSGAVYRSLVSPEDKAFGYIRLGSDELRLLVVSVAITLLGLVGVVVLSMVLGVVVGLVVAAASAGGTPNLGMTIIGVGLLYIVIILAGVAFYVKFSFAGPMTFVKKRITIFGSWSATKGRFWPLFGCYFLAVVLGVVVSMLGMIIGLAALMALGGDFQGVMSPDMSSPAAYFSPGMIAYLVVNSIFTGLTYAIYLAPAMSAYRALHDGPAGMSRTFD